MSDLKQTDLSKRLRESAGKPMQSQDRAKLMLAAADEIERYYTGMLNWKATAEEKDRDFIERRTQPEANAPAQDLSAAIKVARDGLEKISTWSFGWDGDCGVTRVADDTLAAIEAALASSANALSAGELEQVHKFLMGEAPLDGYWFGENSMEIQGIYWWRTKLRAAILQSQKGGK